MLLTLGTRRNDFQLSLLCVSAPYRSLVLRIDRLLLRRLKPVSQPRFSQNQFRFRRVSLNLLPQLIHHYPQIFWLISIIRPPHRLQQSPMRKRFPRIRNQLLQQLKLFRRQMNFFPMRRHLPRLKIYRQLLRLKIRQLR